MYILGFHGGRKREDEDNRVGFELHDSAAILIEDGEVVAAIEEERLSRIKHTNHFPVQAIKYCLSQRKLNLQAIDWIATNFEESVVDFWAKLNYLDYPALKAPSAAKGFVSHLFEQEFGVEVKDKIRFCKHHIAHAWSAFSPSGFNRALILVLDGEGDNRSGMVLVGEGDKLTKLREYSIDQSLGEFYTQVIKLLGYKRFDEYKVMGLAPYGNPNTYAKLFERFYKLLPDGGYFLENPINWFGCFDEAGLLNRSRRKGEPFTQSHKDIAAALQMTLEKIVFHILEHYREATGMKRLCLSGGVAHNCTMNGKILYSNMFDHMFVQPAAHDAGGAWGAALQVLNEEKPSARPRKLQHLYFGTDIGNDSVIGSTLSKWKNFIAYEWHDNINEKAAQLMANGAVLGWVQGRSEFGPRALGNRSILADPRPPGNKLLINQMVKKREDYRPFAPSILEERLRDFFDVPPGDTDLSSMIYVVYVREDKREQLGAITHIDGTARVQTVSRQTNPKYWDLIGEFEKITGVPILLNTSFNNNVEPIVDSVEEAITCFLTTGINYLVVGNYLASKKELDVMHGAYRSLVPSLPPSRRLVKRRSLAQGGRSEIIYELDSTMSYFFSQPQIELSPAAFAFLERVDGKRSVGEILTDAGISEADAVKPVMQQVADMWTKRAIVLRPVKASLPDYVKKMLRT
jgi:carbamoyltransferase